MAVGAVSQIGLGAAAADPTSTPSSAVCPGATATSPGTQLQGSYRSLTVQGNAYVAANTTLNVRHNLTLAPGSCLDAFSLGTVTVGHNIFVRRGATLGLGCAPNVNFSASPGQQTPPTTGIPPCGTTSTINTDWVGHNIIAHQPQTMYLTAVTVGHNVISLGGGFKTLSFPVKDMMIHGNLILAGWQGGPGAWIGAISNHVDGNVVIAGNAGARPGDEIANDSTEVDGNTVGRNLICVRNTPPAQYGDAKADGPPGWNVNTVGGHAIGECADLVAPSQTSTHHDHGHRHWHTHQ
ncbi:MAG: hypothetical protein ACRDKL_11475 [Solirubrobacteraceae bacterium]